MKTTQLSWMCIKVMAWGTFGVVCLSVANAGQKINHGAMRGSTHALNRLKGYCDILGLDEDKLDKLAHEAAEKL